MDGVGGGIGRFGVHFAHEAVVAGGRGLGDQRRIERLGEAATPRGRATAIRST